MLDNNIEPASMGEKPYWIEHMDISTDFGFKGEEVSFAEIGPHGASKLSERFRPVLKIAEGGMGKIYLVQEILSGRHVALKVMTDAALEEEKFVHQFIREAVITARLQHPNVIPVYDLGFLGGSQLYYTMRYVEGKPLDEMLPLLDILDGLRILLSAARAVQHAHSQGLWHRDIKPGNVIVGKFGDVYVIDWGLVSIQPGRAYQLNLPRIVLERTSYSLPDTLLHRTRGAVTESGGFMGTPQYMSPEQAGAAEAQGAPSDIWALGIILFELLTGRHPAHVTPFMDPFEVASRIRQMRHVPPPTSLRPDAPRVLSELCVRMLEFEASQRMSDLGEFVAGATSFLKQSGSSSSLVGPPTRSLVGPPTRWSDRSVPPTVPWHPSQGLDSATASVTPSSQFENLRNERDRYKRKAELLAEMVALGPLEWSRKRQLVAELAKL